MVSVFDVFRSIIPVWRDTAGPVRMRCGSAPGILRWYDYFFWVIHVRSSCFACSCTSKEPTRYRDVADIGYLVKGHQTVECSLTEVCR